MKKVFEGKDNETEYSVLNYRIDLYFHKFKLAIEIDEFGHSNGNIGYEIQRKKKEKSLVVNLLELMLMKKIFMNENS